MPRWLPLLCLIVAAGRLPAGDVGLRLGAESGLFHTADNRGSSLQPTARLDGRVEFRERSGRGQWLLRADLLPEIYLGAATANTTLQGRFLGTYRSGPAQRRIDLSLATEHLRLDIDDVVYRSTLFHLGGGMNWQYREARRLVLRLAYLFRDVVAERRRELDVWVMDGRWEAALSRPLRIEGGLYGEWFVERPLGGPDGASRGIRLGPRVGASWSARMLLRGEYRWLLQRNRRLADRGHDHWVRLMAGRVFGGGWAAFALADLFFRSPVSDTARVSYIPVNSESQVFLKLERELSRTRRIFARLGFLAETLPDSEQDRSGWRMVVGMEVGR